MHFRTELHLSPSVFLIKHQELILLLGSCFSQNIGTRLQNYKFNSISNPFGTIFHPISIARLIQYSCQKQCISQDDLLLSQGIYVHPDFHSSLCHSDPMVTVSTINQVITSVYMHMKEAKYIFITLGTSIGYRQKSTNEIVANCHKLPSNLFVKEDVSVEGCLNHLSAAIEQIQEINEGVKFIFTVSPVRHIKDGMIQNARSKAKLISLVESLTAKYSFVSYFPAYELMMDDLRDYRFYEKDLIHPNEQAIDYIWQKFESCYFDQSTKEINQKLEKIKSALSHRPFNPDTMEHKEFLTSLHQDMSEMEQKYDWIKF